MKQKKENENNYGYGIGRITVPKLKYQYFDNPRKKVKETKFIASFDVTDITDENLTCNVSINANIQKSVFSIEMLTVANMMIYGTGLNESTIDNDIKIKSLLLGPLLKKMAEVIARLTGDSGAYPLIIDISPEEILEESQGALEGE